MRVGFIGAGKVGFTFGRYLMERNVCVSGYYSLNPQSSKEAAQFTQTKYYETLEQIIASSDTLFLTVSDHQIGEVFSNLKKFNIEGKYICHCSGILSSGIFEGISESGAFGYSIHPIYAVNSKLTAYQEFSKAYFTIEGDERHLQDMKAFICSLGNPVEVIAARDKVLYHASAVFASNLVIALYQMAVNMLKQCGLSEDFADGALLSLLTGNVENIVTYGPEESLTGPVERGDTATVKSHMNVMNMQQKEVYRLLSAQLLTLAQKKNVNRDYAAIEQFFEKTIWMKWEEHGRMKNTVLTFKKAKEDGKKLTMLTAYDYSTAKLIDQSGVDAILVGDSLGNVILGYDDTISVTMEDMIHHSAAVARGSKNALVVVDMPFMSYQIDVSEAVRNAGRLMKEGRAQAVKLEGGTEICPQVKAITSAGIPVMGHLGLTPQSIHALGGFRVQGKNEKTAEKLIRDALAIEAAGAFAITLECVPSKLAQIITDKLSIPTIGIGAGNVCDGQVLVYQDMLGMFNDFTPKFVKKFANVGEIMTQAFKDYCTAVQTGSFPGSEHGYTISEEILEKLY